MKTLSFLFEKNKKWAEKIKSENPKYFDNLSKKQTPKYLWIGCSDSRVPPEQILGLSPGDLFVHRNIANTIVHSDINSLSVIQFAVEVLEVKHIIVCGHYGCGGVKAAMEHNQLGLIDNWLRSIKDVYNSNYEVLNNIQNEEDKFNRMCELNVGQQLMNVSSTSFVQNRWNNNKELNIHGWVYDLKEGLLKDLNISVNSIQDLPDIYKLK